MTIRLAPLLAAGCALVLAACGGSSGKPATSTNRALPGSPPVSPGTVSKKALQSMAAISHCMRAHGVTRFPNPTQSPPHDLQKIAMAEGRGGAFLAVPKTINVNAPVFQKAASTCGFGPGAKAKP